MAPEPEPESNDVDDAAAVLRALAGLFRDPRVSGSPELVDLFGDYFGAVDLTSSARLKEPLTYSGIANELDNLATRFEVAGGS